MNEQNNVQVVKDAYAAFGRRETIDWQRLGPAELPLAGVRKGKPEVNRFFKQVDELWQFERFEPRQFIAQGDVVVALGFYSGKAKPTGRPFGCEWSHVFTL